ncbi:MAG: B12-binding domain-containing radical SAM protein [Candidatus Aenigmarchaeota archaeon]|nr:B12-binding domain-containing radical SAM protein [Candidatus Aenigmarchaeota archaeon]
MTIIDQRVESDWKEKLEKQLKLNPIVVGTTGMTGPQLKYSLELSRLVKDFNKDIPVMWGGMHPTMQPHQTLGDTLIDIITIGEGELTFAELVHTLERKGNLRNVKGIGFRENGHVVINESRPNLKNLDELPDLPYHLVDMKKYYAVDFRSRQSIILTTSRGCPFRCTFCIDPAVHKNTWRCYSAERVLEKIRFIIDTYGIRDFFFQDDNFGTDPNRVKTILRGIVNEFDDFAWGTLGIRADAICRMDEEYQQLLVKSGCKNIDVGIESGSPRMIKLMKKDEEVEDFVKANRILAKLFCPYLGTEAWDLSIQGGFKQPTSLNEWANFDFDGWTKNSPTWLDKKRLKIIDNINFTSYFMNKNVKYKISTRRGKVLFDIYNPIAKFRFKHNFYHFPIERKIRDKMLA